MTALAVGRGVRRRIDSRQSCRYFRDLRALANQRASAVRNYLESEGKISRERLFLVEPKLTSDGIKDQGATTRVDFSLK